MPSDEIDRQILLRIPNANDMTDDELAQAILGIDWTSGGEGDTTPPEFVSAVIVNGTTLRVFFDESVTATDETGFTITASGGAATLTMIVNTGSILVFTISREIADDETVTLDYDSGTGDVEDLSGNSLASLTDEPVSVSSSSNDSLIYPLTHSLTYNLTYSLVE